MLSPLLCVVLVLTIGEQLGYHSFLHLSRSRYISQIDHHDVKHRNSITLQYSSSRGTCNNNNPHRYYNGATTVATSTDSPTDIILRLRRKSDRKAFLSYLQFITSYASINTYNFSFEEKKTIASEVDFRVGKSALNYR